MRDNRFDKRSSFRFESTSSDQHHYFPLCSITTANRNINSHLSLSQLSLPFYTENVPRKTPNTGNIYTDILHAIQAVCEPSDLYCSQSYSPVYTDNTHTVQHCSKWFKRMIRGKHARKKRFWWILTSVHQEELMFYSV